MSTEEGQVLQVSREEIDQFLASWDFTGYQSVPLPFHLRVPGEDKSAAVDFYLSGRVEGRSVLDVGTYYGLYPCEAMERGAVRAVGIEQDPERYAIARRIAELNGNRYEIRQCRGEELDPAEKFDLVLLLNVLHHVTDPIEAVSNIARLCGDIMLVEFCLPWDYSNLKFLKGEAGRRHGRMWALARSALMRCACAGLPVMAVGEREYHRTFYFSPEAFRNVFVIHNRIFESITFAPSPSSAFRRVAICRVRQSAA
jgi:SAM-dependent methyltransferase